MRVTPIPHTPCAMCGRYGLLLWRGRIVCRCQMNADNWDDLRTDVAADGAEREEKG